jgi:Family of unknown function (DUF6441)
MVSFFYQNKAKEFAKAIREIEKPIARIATATIRQSSQIAKKEAAQVIKAAGFSARSSRNLRYTLSPERGDAINVSSTFQFRTGYFNLFEEGGTIHGKPLLWLPLPTVPLGRGGRPLRPREYIDRLGPLYSVRGAGTPLLVGARSRSGVLRATRERVTLRKRAVRAGTVSGQNVPLYVGVPSVTVRKKFDVKGVIRRVAAQIPDLYNKISKRMAGQ